MPKLFITIRIWEETKEKLETIRIDLMTKKHKMVSQAETLEILIETYNEKNKKKPTSAQASNPQVLIKKVKKTIDFTKKYVV